MLYYMALFVSICIEVYIIIFKFKVISNEFRTIVIKSILIHLLVDYYMYISFIAFLAHGLTKCTKITKIVK
jgi:hypothetical protein